MRPLVESKVCLHLVHDGVSQERTQCVRSIDNASLSGSEAIITVTQRCLEQI